MNQAKLDHKYLRVEPELDQADEASPSEIVDGLIRPFAKMLWLYRRVLSAVAVLSVVPGGAIIAYCWLTARIEQVASVPFRFQFNGATAGKYPNERPFSESDVIAPAVVSAVYDRNDLSAWMPLEKLENGLFVLRTSIETELLTYEYSARLTDSRLPGPERNRIEQEFKNKLSSAPSQFALMFVASGGASLPPAVLMEKILADLLATWATQSVEQHGVLEREAELPTPAILSNIDSDEGDLLRRTDVLHGKILRLIQDIAEFEKRPGAASPRGSGVAIGLPEIRTGLDDLLRYELEPLYMKTIAGGLADAAVAAQFLDGRLHQLQSEVREAVGRRESLIEAFRLYSNRPEAGVAVANGQPATNSNQPTNGQVVTTPLSDSFLDRLLTMNRQAEDGQFRQAMIRQISQASATTVSLQRNEQLYHNLLALMSVSRRTPAEPAAAQHVAASLDRVQKKAVAALQQAREGAMATPKSSMYSYAGGFKFERIRAVSLPRVVLIVAVVAAAMLLLTSAGCLLHYRYSSA